MGYTKRVNRSKGKGRSRTRARNGGMFKAINNSLKSMVDGMDDRGREDPLSQAEKGRSDSPVTPSPPSPPPSPPPPSSPPPPPPPCSCVATFPAKMSFELRSQNSSWPICVLTSDFQTLAPGKAGSQTASQAAAVGRQGGSRR